MQSIYTCPHCGNKSYNPISKAFAGGMNRKGAVCKVCGRHSVNGVPSVIFSAAVYIAVLVYILFLYFKGNSAWDYAYGIGAILGAYLLCRIFDAFVGRLIKPVRNDVNDD